MSTRMTSHGKAASTLAGPSSLGICDSPCLLATWKSTQEKEGCKRTPIWDLPIRSETEWPRDRDR